MRKKRHNHGVTPGSIFMLVLTLLVAAACFVFLLVIAGEDVYERTSDIIRSFSEIDLFGYPSLEIDELTIGDLLSVSSTPMLTPVPIENKTSNDGAKLPLRQIASQQTASFILTAAGTVCAPRAVRIGAQDDEGFDFKPVFQGLGDLISGSDLTLATLETLVAEDESGYGIYNAPPQLLDGLRSLGIGVLSLATEHVLDKGYVGLELTQREMAWRSMIGIGANAAGQTEDALMLEVNGVQVAVLAYAYGLSDEGREQTAGDPRGALNVIDEDRMVRAIVNARLAGANAVIVMPHWGAKNREETPQDVRLLARSLAEAGADVILGTHPNVVQGTERMIVTRSDGLEYETVVCYSLGCLLTDAREVANTAGMIARLQIDYEPNTRRIKLGELVCEPVYIACEQEDNGSVYRVVDAGSQMHIATLDYTQKEEAARAAQTVRDVTGQNEREQAGHG